MTEVEQKELFQKVFQKAAVRFFKENPDFESLWNRSGKEPYYNVYKAASQVTVNRGKYSLIGSILFLNRHEALVCIRVMEIVRSEQGSGNEGLRRLNPYEVVDSFGLSAFHYVTI